MGIRDAARNAREDMAIPAKKLLLKNSPLSFLKVQIHQFEFRPLMF